MSDESEDSGAFVGKITQKAVLFGPDDRVLVTRVDDLWEPPGGTYEFDETMVDGLRRELREELDLDARVGPPVDAGYGGWIDGTTGNPMVTLVYRCVTEETDVVLNDEHDDYEWVDPETAADRLSESFGSRLATAVERAAALWDDGPFEHVRDPYAEASTEEILDALAEARASDPPDLDG